MENRADAQENTSKIQPAAHFTIIRRKGTKFQPS